MGKWWQKKPLSFFGLQTTHPIIKRKSIKIFVISKSLSDKSIFNAKDPEAVQSVTWSWRQAAKCYYYLKDIELIRKPNAWDLLVMRKRTNFQEFNKERKCKWYFGWRLKPYFQKPGCVTCTSSWIKTTTPFLPSPGVLVICDWLATSADFSEANCTWMSVQLNPCASVRCVANLFTDCLWAKPFAAVNPCWQLQINLT